MKLLIFIVIALAIIVWLQRLKKKLREGHPPTNNKATQIEPAETIVACAHCGLHIPASEAFMDHAGVVFCSAEHRRLYVHK